MKRDEPGLPQTLPYHIMDGIRRRIVTGAFAPDAPIREQELEAIFGSSRGPIREALLLLERRGLVEHMPRRGFRVRSHNAKSIQDLYALRALLEHALVSSFEGRDVQALTATLSATLERMRHHHAARDVDAYFEENLAYHQALIDASDNEFLRRALDTVTEVSLPIRYLLMSRRFSEGKSLSFHESLTRLIQRGEITRAAEESQRDVLSNIPRVVRAYTEAMVEHAAALPASRSSTPDQAIRRPRVAS